MHPDTTKRLPTDYAAAISPGHGEPRIARMTTPRRPPTEKHHGAPRLDTPLLTPADAAQLLAVRPIWIYEAARAGTVPCLRLRRQIHLTRPTLEE